MAASLADELVPAQGEGLLSMATASSQGKGALWSAH